MSSFSRNTAGKKTQLKSAAFDQQKTTGVSALQLKDNRPQSILQKKQVDALAKKETADSSIQKKSNSTGLPDNLKSGIENLSGHSMDDVKVHYHSSKPAQLNAHAYAQGSEIHIASGQEKHLPHEAWHVVQQKQGRVKPTKQLKGKVNVNDDASLEKEADVMGAKAIQKKPDSFSSKISSNNSNKNSPVIQGYFKSNDFKVEKGKDFFVSQESKAKLSKGGKKIQRDKPVTPPLKAGLMIADDWTMAVQDTTQPKVFFATEKVIGNANTQLENVESPLFLNVNSSNAINVGKPLDSVVPIKRKDKDGEKKEELASLWHHICINFANQIMGNKGDIQGDILFENSNTGQLNSQLISPGGKRSTEIERLSHYLSQKPEVKNKKKKGKSIQESALEAMNDKNTVVENIGKEYGEMQGQGRIDKKEQELGINAYAKPEVGEGWSTFSVPAENTSTMDYSVLTKGVPTKRKSTWGYHYAAVIAKSLDGNDRMTLENYRRDPEIEDLIKSMVLSKFSKEAKIYTKKIQQEYLEKKKKLTPQLLGEALYYDLVHKANLANPNEIKKTEDWNKLWYFQMYGSHKGQSFHERMSGMGEFVNPLTVRVRRNSGEVKKYKKEALGDTLKSITELIQNKRSLFYPEVQRTMGVLQKGTTSLFKKFDGYLDKAKSNKDLVLATAKINNEYEAFLRNDFVPQMVTALRSVRRMGKTKNPEDLKGLQEFALQKESGTVWTFLESLSDAMVGQGLLTELREDANSILQNITAKFPKEVFRKVNYKNVGKTSGSKRKNNSNRIGEYHELDGTRIADLLAMRGLSIRETVKDGNCMYDAIRLQLQLVQGLQVTVGELRQKLGTLINGNKHFFGNFINNRKIRNVVNQISSTRSWNNEGGDIAALAIATVLQRNIIVISPDGINIRQPNNALAISGASTVASNGLPLTIVYNGNDHYYSTQ